MTHVRKTVLTLTDACCRWPIGDPRQADFHFCGKPKRAGQSYCQEHYRKAYQRRPSVGLEVGKEGGPIGLSSAPVGARVPVAA